MVDKLAALIAKLALRLGETPPDTDAYEQLGAELADWLLIFSSMTDEEAMH